MGRSPKTEGASGRMACWTVRVGTSPGVLITSITYHPPANRTPAARWLPQSPAVTAPSRRELSGLCLATLVCTLGKCLLWKPSVTAKATGGSPVVPAPTGREPLGTVPGGTPPGIVTEQNGEGRQPRRVRTGSGIKNLRRTAADRTACQVFFTNFSRHLGQVMAMAPLPRGTRTCWRHRGQ